MVASNQGSMASGSENPAALAGPSNGSLYTTNYVGESSRLSESLLRSNNPIQNRVLEYLSMGAEKGTLYFEPLGRREGQTIQDPAQPTTDFTEYKFSANAIGFAGTAPLKSGSIGLSFAYLYGSLASTVHQNGTPDKSTLDTASGVRLNMGLRYPTGPFMWGAVLQNAPGFLWWGHYRRDMLPLRVRVGNTWRLSPGVLFSAESETRYYEEGSHKEHFLYLGSETAPSKTLVFRAGVFSNSMGQPDTRHWTGGITLNFQNDVTLSYALESFLFENERVKKSILSIRVPMTAGDVSK
jgi:hypothetical protein